MISWIIIDLFVFIVVMGLSGFIIPQILLIAFRKNLFDDVDPRKIHKGAVPRLGGIAFFPSILFSLLLTFGIGNMTAPGMLHAMLIPNLSGLCFTCCAIIILYLVGMADDLIGLKYRAKFIAQIVAAALVIIPGLTLDNLHGFLGVFEMHTVAAVILTGLLIVFITNAINLIDGIDGLASGLSAIACAFYGYIFYQAGLHIMAMVSFATLGALIPFFYYNVFGNVSKHRKIFMGDTGALTIGLLLSVQSIRICRIDDGALNINPAVVAFAPLLIPCCDVVRVYLHRLRHHKNPFLPDKTHIHHKFLALGMSQRIAMPTIVAASVLLSLFNYWLSGIINITVLFAIDLAIWVAANTILSHYIRKREAETGLSLYN